MGVVLMAKIDTNEESQLIFRCKNKDREAFDQLIEKYRDRAYAMAYSIVHNNEDAVDVLQEAFIKVFENIGSFKGDSRFYTWLYRILFNLAVDCARRKKNTNVSLDDEDALPSEQTLDIAAHGTPTPSDELDRRELGELLNQCLSRIPLAQRTAVLLCDVEGLSYAEIAEVMQIAEGTVMSRLHYGRQRLAAMLEPYLQEGKISQVENESNGQTE